MKMKQLLRVLFVFALAMFLHPEPTQGADEPTQCCTNAGFPCTFAACMDACLNVWPQWKCENFCWPLMDP